MVQFLNHTRSRESGFFINNKKMIRNADRRRRMVNGSRSGITQVVSCWAKATIFYVSLFDIVYDLLFDLDLDSIMIQLQVQVKCSILLAGIKALKIQ